MYVVNVGTFSYRRRSIGTYLCPSVSELSDVFVARAKSERVRGWGWWEVSVSPSKSNVFENSRFKTMQNLVYN